MTSEAYQKILAVQDTDLKVRQLQHKHEHHELRSQLAQAQKSAVSIREQLANTGGLIEDLVKAQQKLQHRVAELTTKKESSQAKLYGGQVTAANELLALEEEVAGYKAKQDSIEDELLELMEQTDELLVSKTETDSLLTAAEKEIVASEDSLGVALRDIETEIETHKTNRVVQTQDADVELLKRYEELAPQFEGLAVAQMSHGGCDGCHIQLSVVALDRIERLPEDAHVNCEECGRLLVR